MGIREFVDALIIEIPKLSDTYAVIFEAKKRQKERKERDRLAEISKNPQQSPQGSEIIKI